MTFTITANMVRIAVAMLFVAFVSFIYGAIHQRDNVVQSCTQKGEHAFDAWRMRDGTVMLPSETIKCNMVAAKEK
jgi:hypothetical protein